MTSEENYHQIYLVFTNADTNSNKFWQAVAHPTGSLVTSWGRVGYKGQTKSYQCGSYQVAVVKLTQLARAKKLKGYIETVAQIESQEQSLIKQAIQLLELIHPHVEQRDFSNRNWNYLNALNEYLTIIPTPLGMKIDPASIFSLAEVNRQRESLKRLLRRVPDTPETQSSSSSCQSISLKSISASFWKAAHTKK
jgi:predicted DNA-binding WGR domain protein